MKGAACLLLKTAAVLLPPAFLAVLSPGMGTAQVTSRPVSQVAGEALRNRLEAAASGAGLLVGWEVIYAADVLPVFYERRAYRLAWSGDAGPSSEADSLVAVIRGASREGLRPSDYHLERIEGLLGDLKGGGRSARPVDPRVLADLDLLLTDAFLSYGFHLLNGRVDPETIDPDWHVERTEVDLASALEDALGGNHMRAALEDLLPRSQCYYGLRQARAAYESLADRGGWPAVPEGANLEVGSSGERVGLLRTRLEVTGETEVRDRDRNVFDADLEGAVREFQRRHGLDADGVVGPKTLAALNVTASERVRQVEVNMERWRWLPRDLGDRYIQINIAGFELDVFEAGRRILNMRAITGLDYRRTPVFSDVMTYVVINPYWNVPHKLAVEDKLPLIKKDPSYLSNQKIRVLKGWGADMEEVDPWAIDWSGVTRDNFGWRLRQDPGPLNALGRIKFMFPNKYDVYLHDTPSRDLFEQPVRAFSSGCIRIESPIDLAEYLLRGYPEWTRPAILSTVDKGMERTVRLLEPIPVHILYCTAWADESGRVSFRNDLYGRDKPVADALMELPPTASQFGNSHASDEWGRDR